MFQQHVGHTSSNTDAVPPEDVGEARETHRRFDQNPAYGMLEQIGIDMPIRPTFWATLGSQLERGFDHVQ